MFQYILPDGTEGKVSVQRVRRLAHNADDFANAAFMINAFDGRWKGENPQLCCQLLALSAVRSLGYHSS